MLCIEGTGERDGDAEILGLINARLPAWKRPRDIAFVESLPRTSNGKILRRKLREFLNARAV